MSLTALPIQRLVNEALAYDPRARRRLATLAGRSLVLEMSEPSLTLAVSIEAGATEDSPRLEIGFEPPAAPDARVSGRAADLLAVLRAPDRTQAMMAHRIEIQGDTRTFFTLQEVLSELDIDWELALGDRLGDLPAHWLAEGLRGLGGVARTQSQSLERTLVNYLREESRALVPRSLWQAHAEAVYEARLATDRLAARVARLDSRLRGRGGRDS